MTLFHRLGLGLVLGGLAWAIAAAAPSSVVAAPVVPVEIGSELATFSAFPDQYTLDFQGTGPTPFCTGLQGISPIVSISPGGPGFVFAPSFKECLATGCYCVFLNGIGASSGAGFLVFEPGDFKFHVCATTDTVTTTQPGFFSYQGNILSSPVASGSGVIGLGAAAPEVDPTTFVTPLALGVGALYIVADRRRNRRQPAAAPEVSST